MKRTFTYERGGAHGNPSKADSLKSKISSALRGGATDAEIKEMIDKSGLAQTYDIKYDNVEMTVSVTPKKDNRFGPKDPPGQRGDMFDGGGKTASQLIKEYEAILNRTGLPEEQYDKYSRKVQELRASAESDRRAQSRAALPQDEAAQGMRTYEQGGRTYAGQYMGKVMEDEGGKYANYEDMDGNMTKVYFMEDPGQVGEYVPDNDYLFEEIDGKMTARLAEGFESERNPKERELGKRVMSEGTQGASKVENLLENLMDMGRGARKGTRTFRY